MSLPELSSADLSAINGILTLALSPDPSQRTPAERAITTHLTHHPAPFILALTTLLTSSPDESIRSLSSVLLRTKLTAGEPLLFDTLPPPLQSLLRSTLLHALLSEPTRAVKLLIADAVSELASVLLYKAEYPECVPFLARLLREGDAAHIVLALTIVGKLTDTLDTLLEHLPVLSPLLASSLSHPSVDVQVAAVHALCKLLAILEDDRQRKEHARAFTPILSILLNLLRERRDDDALKVVGSLVEVVGEADGDGLLMKSVMDRYALLMMIVACTGTPVMSTLTTSFSASALSPFTSLLPSAASTSATAYSDDLRHLAMEWTVSFAEDQPRLVRRSKTFITAALLSAFALLLSVDDVAVQEWAQQTSDDEEDSFDVGLVASDRLAEAIKGAKLTPVLLPFFHTLLASSSWQYQHAGLRLLASTAAVLPFEEIPIPTVMSSLSSPHPRVRYAAVECLGQLADDFRPHLQEQYHQQAFTQLLPSLMAGEWPRLQSHACIAFFNLCVDLEEAIMARYAPQLLDVLLALLTSAVKMVQEQVLATIAAIATAAPSLFTTYYPRVVPLIKHVIVEARGKDHAMLRARAMESLTMIGMSMKRDLFRADAIHLMHIFLAIMSSGGGGGEGGEEEKGRMGLAVDDVSEQFMLQAWTRICTVLGEEFTPMLERLLPVIFASAGQRVDVVLREEGGGEGEEGRRDEFASSLEDKSNAMSMLVSFCHDLTVGFFPYVQQTAAITIPLLAYPLSSDIRSYAITLMPLLVTSAVAAYKAQRCDLAYVKALMSAVVAGVLDRFKAEEETELLDALVRSLKECVVAVRDVGIARECLDGDGLGVVCDALLRMLESSRLRIAAREKRMEEEEEDEEGMDEDSMVTMEAAIYEEDALHITIADCIGTLIQSHQAAFLPTFHRLTPELLSLLQPSASLNSKRVSVFLFDDLIEYGGLTEVAAVDRLFAAFLPHLLTYVALYPAAASSSSSSGATASRQDASLRQACAYGLGVCAAAHPTAFAPFVDRTVSSLLTVIDDLPARLTADSNSSSSDVDNSVSALGKIAVMTVDGAQPYARLLSQWLFALPIRDDEEEGHAVYAQLVRLIEQHHARLFVDDRHALQVLYVLSSVVGSAFVDEEVNAKIVAILGVMKRDMGMHGDAREVKGRLKGMTVEQRQKVVDVLEAM